MEIEIGASKKTFSRDLSDVLRNERRRIPLVLEHTTDYLLENGKLNERGWGGVKSLLTN